MASFAVPPSDAAALGGAPGATPTLLCFLVMMTSSGGYELGLVRAQFERGVGVFGCDQYAVFSDLRQWLGQRQGLPVESVAFGARPSEAGSLAQPGQTTNSWLNTGTFARAWDMVLADGRFRAADWVVKVDPDTVFFPDRLRQHLLPHTTPAGESLYVLNCNRYVGMLFGAIEVLSRRAVEAYFDGKARCQRELEWGGWGEDFFLQHCLDLLWVRHVNDFGLLSDMRGHCTFEPPSPCILGQQVAFHPFKLVDSYFQCIGEAARAQRIS